jgi:hypothetical protein
MTHLLFAERLKRNPASVRSRNGFSQAWADRLIRGKRKTGAGGVPRPQPQNQAPRGESCYPSITMSKLTGDKARYNRNRKRKAAKRLSLRPLRAAAAAPPLPAK